ARMFDMQHDPATADILSYQENSERNSIFNRLPRTQQDWHDKTRAVDTVLKDVGGVVTRVGDETVGEVWSLYDGREVLAEIDPRFADNTTHHIGRILRADMFRVSANTGPQGDRSRRPQDQGPDMLVH